MAQAAVIDISCADILKPTETVTIDAIETATAAPAPEIVHDGRGPWALLDRLERAAIGARAPGGAVTVRRSELAGCILYGPYWHLQVGRLSAVFSLPRRSAPVLRRSRCSVSRSSSSAAFSARGAISPRRSWPPDAGTLIFDVPPELSIDGGNEARFEFRFFHLGNADLTIEAVELEQLPDEFGCAAPDPRHWRLLGRLHHSWRGRRHPSGAVTVKQGQFPGRFLLRAAGRICDWGAAIIG